MKRVRKATGCSVPTVTMYRAPTVAGLASALAGMPRAAPGSIPKAPFTPAQKAAGVPCPSNMEAFGTGMVEAPEDVGAKLIPVTLRLTGTLDVGALRAALAHIVGRHEPLRTRFVLRHGQARAPTGLGAHSAPVTVLCLCGFAVCGDRPSLCVAGFKSSRLHATLPGAHAGACTCRCCRRWRPQGTRA